MENNNKLIAEFLGIQIEEGQERIYINGLGTELIEYTFNTDWNWLMKAVDKIEKEYSFSVLISWQHCIIESNSCEFRIEKDSDTKLKATYTAVVEFIKLHNEQ